MRFGLMASRGAEQFSDDLGLYSQRVLDTGFNGDLGAREHRSQWPVKRR